MTCSRGVYRKLVLRGGASMLALALAFGGAVNAQEDDADTEEEIAQIIVTGVRASIQKATDAKRASAVIGDAYFAEQIGKSSDETITEALQRLPGVVLERGGGAGADQGTVVVRGISPALNLIKFNGTTLTSNTDDQAVDLSSFSADILSSIVVAKSPEARQEEGSLGGTIYLNTVSPIDAEDTFIFGAEGRYNDLADKVTPRATFSFLKRLSDTFGLSGSFFWDHNESRTDTFETFLGAFVDPRNEPLDAATGAVLADRAAISDGFANYRVFERDTNKFGGTLSAHFRPDDVTEIRVDFAYSDQTQDFTMYENRGIASSFGQGENQPPQLSVVDTASGRVVEYYRAGDGSPLIQTREQTGDTENYIIGVDAERRFGDWTVHAKFGRSVTDQFIEFQTWNLISSNVVLDPEGASFGPGNGLCGHRFEEGKGGVSLPVYFDCPRFNFDDPSSMAVPSGSFFEREVSDKLNSFYLDVSKDFQGGFITRVSAGGKYTDRTKDRFSAEAFFIVNNLDLPPEVQDMLVPDQAGFLILPATLIEFNTAPAPLEGIAPDGASQPFPVANLASINALLFPNGVPDDAFVRNPSDQFVVEEETAAAYIQVDFDGWQGRLTGNVGVRYAYTKVVGTGAGGFQFSPLYVGPGGTPYPEGFSFPNFQDTNDYSNWLPSLNVRYEVTDELLLRLAASRVLARPSLSALAPGFTVIDRDPATIPRGSGGNTQLDPFLANQGDISLEWYFNDDSLLAVTVFYKDMESFTFGSSVRRNFENPVTGEPCLVNRSNAPIAQQNTATVEEFGCIDALFSTQVNGATAELLGIEFGYTQVYDFLPGIWQFLGLSTNYTFVDSESVVDPDNPDSIFNILPFQNLSRNSINSILFWDDGDLSLRLAHTYRDRALIQVNNNNSSVFRNPRHTVDFAANYAIMDNLLVTFSVTNLTNSFDTLFEATAVSGDPNIPVQISESISAIPDDRVFRLNHQGRSFRLGVRYTL